MVEGREPEASQLLLALDPQPSTLDHPIDTFSPILTDMAAVKNHDRIGSFAVVAGATSVLGMARYAVPLLGLTNWSKESAHNDDARSYRSANHRSFSPSRD